MRCLVAAVAVVMLAGPAAAVPAGEPVTLWIDGEPRGDVVALVDGARIAVPAELLCAARLCVTGGVERDGVRYVFLDQLAGAVRVRFDRDTGELRLAIDTGALPATTVALASTPPANLEHATSPSLFVNYALTGGAHALGDAAYRASLTGALEGGLSLAGTLAYSSVNLLDASHVARGLSSYTVDWRRALVRLVAGDEVVTGGPLGGGGVLGGLHASRDFSIDPYFVAQPTLTTSGVAQTASTVEVYRDGQLIRREVLPPGPYQISDLIGSAGADTRVVVRDAFGLTRSVVTTSLAPLASALQPGLSTFDYSIGLVRRLGTASFDYGMPALLAVHRRGMTQALTLGARFEAAADRASGGLTADVVRGHVAIEAALAASVADRDAGSSATGDAPAAVPGTALAPAALISVAWFRPGLSLAASVRAIGARYATLQLVPADDRTVRALDATGAWSMSAHATLLVQATAEHLRDAGDRVRGSTTASFELGRTTRLFAAVNGARQPGLTTVEATATLAISLGAHTTATATGSVGDGASLGAAAGRAMPAREGYGYQARVTTGKTDDAFASAAVQGEHGRLEASAEWTSGSRDATLSISGGVVAIGGTAAATRAVQGGFALVRVPDAPGVRAYLDNQPMGATDRHGDLILPELQAFYGNRIRIDARDLPLDVATGALERVIAPARRGGVIVAFAPARAATLRGRLVGARGTQAIDVSYGDLQLDGGAAVPIGHAGAFELESVATGHHRGVVAVDGLACGFELDVAATAGIVELGTLTCQVMP